MRDIKFRAWDKTYNIMIDPEAFNRNDIWISGDGKVYEIEEWSDYSGGGKVERDCTDQYILMQYTGVHDDTDDEAELYDGDIVEVEHEGQKHICKVMYCGGGYLFAADSLPDSFLWFSDLIEFECEYCWAEGTKKLGNIHDNPNLLGGRTNDKKDKYSHSQIQ